MKIEYNNLYTHFVFTTLNRKPIILEQFRIRIEKYITGRNIIKKRDTMKSTSDFSNFINKQFVKKGMPDCKLGELGCGVAGHIMLLRWFVLKIR